MKTVGLFIDTSNILHNTIKKFNGRKLDYAKYRDKVVGENSIYRAFAYGLITNEGVKRFVTSIKHQGYDPKYEEPYTYIDSRTGQQRIVTMNFDVEITLDIVRCAEKLDEVILGTTSLSI